MNQIEEAASPLPGPAVNARRSKAQKKQMPHGPDADNAHLPLSEHQAPAADTRTVPPSPADQIGIPAASPAAPSDPFGAPSAAGDAASKTSFNSSDSGIGGVVRRLRLAAAQRLLPAEASRRFIKDDSKTEPRITPASQAAPPSIPDQQRAATESAGEQVLQQPQATDPVPPSLRARYLVSDNKFYFRDPAQTLAFEDRGKRITTSHDDADVATSMVELAQAKGWSHLKLKGSLAFKREAWLAATERGLDVGGYRPTELDKARLAERTKAQQRTPDNVVERARPQASPESLDPPKRKRSRQEKKTPARPIAREDGLSRRHGQAVDGLKAFLRQRGDSEKAVEMTAAIAVEQMRHRRTHFGQIIDHGEAPFKHLEDNDLSYFVTLETPLGKQTVWGIDLQRAIIESGLDIGTAVVLTQRGKDDVTVLTEERDTTGNFTGNKRYIDAIRNRWTVTSLDGARDFEGAHAFHGAGNAEGPNRDRTSPMPTPYPQQPRSEPVRDMERKR